MKFKENMKVKTSIRVIALIVAVLGLSPLNAQKVVQTVKGIVYDKQSKVSLPGATVYIAETNPVKGTITDENGHFRIENVETGRIRVCVRYLGYEPVCIDNQNLTSGKELVLNIEIQESVTNINEVVVKADQNKSSTISIPCPQ